MRSPLGAFIFIAIILLLDIYVFQALKTVNGSSSSRTKAILYTSYWVLTALVILSILIFSVTQGHLISKVVRTYGFAIIIGIFLAKLTAVFFIVMDDLRRAIQWIGLKIIFNSRRMDTAEVEGISRSVFLSWLGLAAGSSLFGSLIYGFSNKYNYKIKRINLAFDNLPAGFKGMKIVQISDIHAGSFTNSTAVQQGVDKILQENADIILFTGDLVNDKATEMEEYLHIFSQLKAPLGVYSILGNHDYGDYIKWPQDGISREDNLDHLKKMHGIMGWRLLMNEHVVLEKGADKIALLGVENWSAKARFPKHGKMDLAYKGAEKYPFKILMSHDPSHWDAQVKENYPDIDLMLSGHTHGMQFGIQIPGFKWSPVQYMYKQWAGLYEDEKQKLYVNPGFGFIGYPGRVGILPEITVIELG